MFHRQNIARRVDRLEHAQASRSWRSPFAAALAATPIPDGREHAPRHFGRRAA